MMQEVSQNIISDCSNIGAVSFGIWGTDSFEVYGIIDGQVRQFGCVEFCGSPPGERIDWGLQGCS